MEDCDQIQKHIKLLIEEKKYSQAIEIATANIHNSIEFNLLSINN